MVAPKIFQAFDDIIAVMVYFEVINNMEAKQIP